MLRRRRARAFDETFARAERGDAPTVTGPIPRAVHEQLAALFAERSALRADLQLVQNAASLRERILTAMDEGVILANDGEVVYANPAATALFGVDRLQRLPAVIRPPAGPGPETSRISLHHPVPRELRCVATDLGGGTMLAALQDVTAEARVEAVRRDFVANASHEMKTPVAAILATAETLNQAIADDQPAVERFAATLVVEARRLSSLIQELLDLARLDRPQSPPEPVAFSTLVEEELALVRPRAAAAGLTLTCEIAPAVVVPGSAEDLVLLVRNLLDNAVRYTPASGAVTVVLSADDTGAVLRVIDTGVGIASRDLPRIFERFYRVDPARARETGGTGLGLAIVRHVAESHGGAVTVESTLGAGSAFTARFPLAP